MVAAPVHARQACATAAVQAAAEVDEALGTVDECGEQIGSHHVHGQDLRSGRNGGVVDHRAYPAAVVRLIGDAACLLDVGQISDDDRGASILELDHRLEPILVANMDDDVVLPVLEQRLCSRPSETVGRASDENACDPDPPLSAGAPALMERG